MFKFSRLVNSCKNDFFNNKLRRISYVQGQSPEPKVREYFYYIDHQGMVSSETIQLTMRIQDYYLYRTLSSNNIHVYLDIFYGDSVFI